MRAGGLTERYVKALSGMGLDRASLERLANELAAVAEIYGEGTELREVLENPAFDDRERRAALTSVVEQIKASRVCRNTLFLLADKKRTRLLPELASELGRHLDRESGIVRARVVSAQPLLKAQVKSLTAVLAALQSKPVRIETEVDSELIGGVLIEMAGIVYDGSVKKRLASIREGILKEAR